MCFASLTLILSSFSARIRCTLVPKRFTSHSTISSPPFPLCLRNGGRSSLLHIFTSFAYFTLILSSFIACSRCALFQNAFPDIRGPVSIPLFSLCSKYVPLYFLNSKPNERIIFLLVLKETDAKVSQVDKQYQRSEVVALTFAK